MRWFTLFVLVACSSGSSTPVVNVAKPIDAATGPSPAEAGKKLFETQGCDGCHTIDGTPKVGRSMKGVWDTDVTLKDGRTLHVDAKYLKDSIQNPVGYDIPGYNAPMPAYEGKLTDDQLDALVAYIQTLK
jgi:cytochrome c oxidase subunit 2